MAPPPLSAPPGRRARAGFVLVGALLVLVAGTALATLSLRLALSRIRMARAVVHRVQGDLLAEGTLFLAARGSPVSWNSGSVAVTSGPLGEEVAYLRAEARGPGAPAARVAGGLAWEASAAVILPPGAPWIGAGGSLGVSGPLSADSLCPGGAPDRPLAGAPPPRWNAPLDLASGWRGGRPPDDGELQALRTLPGAVLHLLEPGGALPPGPAVLVSPGDLTLLPGDTLSGLLLVSGDLSVPPGARIRGVIRALGDVEFRGEFVPSRCALEGALAASGLAGRRHPLPGDPLLLP